MTLDDVVSALRNLSDLLIYISMTFVFLHGLNFGRTIARK
jgi:hypothetical protein